MPTTLFALLPTLSVSLFFLKFGYELKKGVGPVIVGLCIFSSLAFGLKKGNHEIGLCYAILFSLAALFRLGLQKEIEVGRRNHRARHLALQEEVQKKKFDLEKMVEIRSKLASEMERTNKRYAFAKRLVSTVEEKPMLSDLASIFSSEKQMLATAFFLRQSFNQDEEWRLVFSKGRFEEEEKWRKILKPAELSLESVHCRSLAEVPQSLDPGVSLSLVSVPIKWDKKVQGLLAFLLSGPLPKTFLDEVSVYAQLLGLGLQKASLYRLVIERSRRDGLTNLYLRRIFMERLNEEVSFSKRYGTSFSVLMLDLDHFKKVNDTYGHPAGDTVLKSVAECMRTTLHPGVLIARYGGEEFSVLMGLTPTEEVMEHAEKLRSAIQNTEIPLAHTERIKLKVSIGVAHYLPETPSPEELMRRADTALYRAKESGRNCVREWKE